MQEHRRPVALITGGSRGIGAATARELADRGYDVLITYHNKARRANAVVADIEARGAQGLAIACDITREGDLEQLFAALKEWRGSLDVLDLNASGGLERDRLAVDPDYPMHINRDAQMALVDHALPLMSSGGVIVFVTSHFAHWYGLVSDIPAYEPIAESKYAGEQALRARQPELSELGLRLVVVTGDLIEGTITPKLLEKTAPGLANQRRDTIGALPTADEMGEAIAVAAVDASLPSGHTIVIGGSLEVLLRENQE